MGAAEKPVHLQRGELGEAAAKRHLQGKGLKFLCGNYKSQYGEIDLIFREDSALVFVEVKTRSSEEWTRPASAVNAGKRRRLARTARDYIQRLKDPEVRYRFDVVEVLLEEGAVGEIRHLPNAFSSARRIWRG